MTFVEQQISVLYEFKLNEFAFDSVSSHSFHGLQLKGLVNCLVHAQRRNKMFLQQRKKTAV